MELASRFEINERRVIGEVFEDEVVLVNLENGNYYTLDGVGAMVWSHLQTAPTLDELVATVSIHYEGVPEEIAAGLNQLLESMVVEGVLVKGSAAPTATKSAPPDPAAEQSGRPRFTPPVLTKFTDMQDLLLLDPIHDVDESSGWPTKPVPDASSDKAA
jgi:hypothetical protein